MTSIKIFLALGLFVSCIINGLNAQQSANKNQSLDIKHQSIVSISARQNATDSTKSNNNLFAKGAKAPANNFTGSVWVNIVVQAQDGLNCSIGTVTFEPGARSNWHMHPGGQILLVTEGKGYYQERGQPIRIMQKGDVVKCPPGIEHWHGASPDTKLTHIAIATNAEKGNAVWLQRVTDEEYKVLNKRLQ